METYFSKNAKKLLNDKNLTQTVFCEKLGKKKSNWENIVRTNNIDMLSQIAEILDMSLEDVIGLNKRKFSICGFVKINDQVHEITTKADLETCLTKINALENQG